MVKIIISAITLEQVKIPGFCNVTNPKRKFNSIEYLQATQATNFSRYIHILKMVNPETKIWTYQFTEDEIKILIPAGYITTLTMRPSKIHQEELAEIEERLQKQIPPMDTFFRLDACSTKDSTFGVGPIKSANDVIKRIVTSQKAIYSFENRDSNIIIFKPWQPNIKIGNEFRCFFYQRHLTAISQYSPYEYYEWDKKHDSLIKLVNKVNQLYHQILPELSKLEHFENCVMDIYYHEDQSIEILEFNPFGWELNSGSACFHWQNDHDILYNENQEVEVRIIQEAILPKDTSVLDI